MMKCSFICSVLMFGMLSACSQFEPYVDSRREAGQVKPVGQSTKEKVAVCYNPLWHSQMDIDVLAQDTCAEQKKQAIYEETKYFNCSLVSPNTAFYRCK